MGFVYLALFAGLGFMPGGNGMVYYEAVSQGVQNGALFYVFTGLGIMMGFYGVKGLLTDETIGKRGRVYTRVDNPVRYWNWVVLRLGLAVFISFLLLRTPTA